MTCNLEPIFFLLSWLLKSKVNLEVALWFQNFDFHFTEILLWQFQFKNTQSKLNSICNVKGFPIRGFILIYKKNTCFLWKIISFLFHSIAEGLPLMMKNNIIDMVSTTTFSGPCSFHEIFHYIFAHLGLYHVTPKKKV